MEKMRYSFASYYRGIPGLVKIERGERGEMKNHQDVVEEWVDIGENFSGGSSWVSAGGTLSIHYRNQALHDKPTMTGGIYIDFWATSLTSVLYLDDFKLVQKE